MTNFLKLFIDQKGDSKGLKVKTNVNFLKFSKWDFKFNYQLKKEIKTLGKNLSINWINTKITLSYCINKK